MDRSIIVIVLALLSGTVTSVQAAGPFDGSQSLLCVAAEVFECDAADGCREVRPADIDAPRFFRIDFADKVIIGARLNQPPKSTPIERTELLEDKLLLQGAEDGEKGVEDGVGWSIAIGQSNGTMVLSAAGLDVSFTAFGACMPL